MYVEYQKAKINIIDAPGYFDFAGEVAEAPARRGHRRYLRLRQGRPQRRRGEAWKSLNDAGLPARYISPR